MAAKYCWKGLNALFLSFVNLLSFRYKHHNQNKNNKNRDLLYLLVQSWIYEERTLHIKTVYFLLSLFFIGNANCVSLLYHA